MRIHRAALVAVCCALPLLAGTAIGCGSPNDSCSGPYRALYAYCAGDGGEEASEAATPVDGGLDVLSEGSAPTEGGEAGCVAPTSLLCGTTCENPTLPANCGSCGHVCEAGTGGTATCTAGQCGVGCSGSTPDNCNGACVDETTDPNNCGTCSHTCPGPTNAGSGLATCSPGADGGPACGLACTAPTSQACGGACANPTDPTTCGSSCLVCPQATAGTGTPVCTLGSDGGGECSVTCTGTTTETCPGGACYAPLDPNHCGSCTNACPAPPSGNGQATCASPSTCGVSCTTAYHVCAADCLENTDEPSDTADPCIINEQFGIFVSPTGSDSAAGTQLTPVATVGHAMDLARAAGKRVYACGSAGNYTVESLVVGASRDGVKAYGGLNCTTAPSQWIYSAGAKATMAPATGYALQVSGLTVGVTFEDFGFVAANATGVGASSIAVFASSATGVVLQRCNVQTGTATQGHDQQPTAQASPAPSGNPGGASKAAGGSGAGGTEQPNPSCPTSFGGAGGSAVTGELDGQSGQVGPLNAGTSAGCNALPTPQGGGAGVSATTAGSPGPGASDWATFSAAGWSPLGGGPGGAGSTGQGGGGGGVQGVVTSAGGGGGGGAGGCGGGGGAGAAGGGSSIAILAYNSSVTLLSCTLTAGTAGRGGNGAAGQPGQPGGGGGAGNNVVDCSGGPGGAGSAGGAGGGGAGGLSAGVLWTGTAPTVTGGAQTPGAAGAAGQNGDGSTTAKAGTAGGVVQFQ